MSQRATLLVQRSKPPLQCAALDAACQDFCSAPRVRQQERGAAESVDQSLRKIAVSSFMVKRFVRSSALLSMSLSLSSVMLQDDRMRLIAQGISSRTFGILDSCDLHAGVPP